MSRHLPIYVAVAALFCGNSTVLEAQPNGADREAIFLKCKSIGDDRERLRCFDAAVDAPVQARPEPKAPFGLAQPKAPAIAPEMRMVESTVTRAAPSGRGRFTVTLADGSVWRTTETARISPEAGNRVRIRRAAFGSYLARFGSGEGVKVQRVR